MNEEECQPTAAARTMSAWRPHAACAALYLALALLATRGLLADPAARVQNLGDPLLNACLLDWTQYALFHQLGGFFQANFFWPHADALAYGEHLLTPALLALPARILTRNPVALHNISVAQALVFSAIAAHALGFHCFRSVKAALLTGLFYGFAPYRLGQLGHIQLIHGEFLPLAVLAFERLLARASRRTALMLAAAVAAQGLTSWYWAVFTFWSLGLYGTGRLWQSRRALTRAALIQILVSGLLAAAILLFVALPYISLKRKNVLFRPAEDLAALAARPGDFLARSDAMLWPGAWIMITGRADSVPHSSERLLGLGDLAMLGLACAALLATRRPPRDVPLRLWLALAAILLVFAFGRSIDLGGTGLPLPYALVERWFPFASVMRVPARWLAPALLPLSLAAAFALDRFAIRRGRGIGWVVICAAVLESLTRKTSFVEVERGPDEAVRRIAEAPFPSPVLELPPPPLDDNRPMLHAAWHRQPTVNGTNGFFPPGHLQRVRRLAGFPDPAVVDELRRINVRFVLIDLVRQGAGGTGAGEAAAAIARSLPEGALMRRCEGGKLLVDLGNPRK